MKGIAQQWAVPFLRPKCRSGAFSARFYEVPSQRRLFNVSIGQFGRIGHRKASPRKSEGGGIGFDKLTVAGVGHKLSYITNAASLVIQPIQIVLTIYIVSEAVLTAPQIGIRTGFYNKGRAFYKCVNGNILNGLGQIEIRDLLLIRCA